LMEFPRTFITSDVLSPTFNKLRKGAMYKFPYNRQDITQEDVESVVQALRSDYLTTGPRSEAFEKALANYVGAKYAVVVANGTAALHLALTALDLEESDVVVTSPITFIADANVVRLVGAQIEFSDIILSSGNIDLKKIRSLLERRPEIRVLLLVHFAGHPLDMIEMGKIAEDFDVKIIEDGCHALGARYLDKNGRLRNVGSCEHSIMTTFSFHPIKSITTGEGGAITTNSLKLYRRLLKLRSHGVTKEPDDFLNVDLSTTVIDGVSVTNPWYYEMHELSTNYRLTDFQCALGLSQLSRIDLMIESRNRIANAYYEELSRSLRDVVTPLTVDHGIRHAYHLFVVRINFSRIAGGRAAIMRFMMDKGIQTQVNYLPIYHHPYYRRYLNEPPTMVSAETYYSECLSLPIFPSMTSSDVIEILNCLREAIDLRGIKN